MIAPQSYENPRLRELMAVLTEWINDELASHRIIVKDLEEDLYDGQVLHKLIGECMHTYKDLPVLENSAFPSVCENNKVNLRRKKLL